VRSGGLTRQTRGTAASDDRGKTQCLGGQTYSI
jgi:hypothetical protein